MKLIAHRNETPNCPENSIASLEYSAQEGIYAVECDLRRTGDGQYVIYHDEDLRRLCGDPRPVNQLTLEQMQSALARANRRVITFSQLIAGYQKQTPILLHVKERVPRPDLLALFRRGRESVELIFGVESLEMLRAVEDAVNVPVIASGGAGSIQDFVDLFREIPEIDAGLAASIFHFGEVSIRDLKEELARQGINVRL